MNKHIETISEKMKTSENKTYCFGRDYNTSKLAAYTLVNRYNGLNCHCEIDNVYNLNKKS